MAIDLSSLLRANDFIRHPHFGAVKSAWEIASRVERFISHFDGIAFSPDQSSTRMFADD